MPGPAAYGQGGKDATVTDANIVLGRLDVHNFLGGAMPLDRAAAIAAVQALADESRAAAARGRRRRVAVLNANMANAIRARTVQKGIDPRQYALVASGGAGPLHGAEVAQMLGIPEVVVPPYPGINSAIGLLTTDLKYDVVRTAFLVSNRMDLERMNADLAAIEQVVRAQLTADGLDPARATIERVSRRTLRGPGLRASARAAAGAPRRPRPRRGTRRVSTSCTSGSTDITSRSRRSSSSTCG